MTMPLRNLSTLLLVCKQQDLISNKYHITFIKDLKTQYL